MIRIINTFPQLNTLFDEGRFNMAKWEKYINGIFLNSAELFCSDLKDSLQNSHYTYENDVLPVIQAVYKHPMAEKLNDAFCKVTNGLDDRVKQCFGREVEVDIVLYLGLCNGAGWVTEINGRPVILLGIEKILELSWQDEQAMCGLIYHELGHVYHNQFGALQMEEEEQDFIWQLFTEGIAMCFEQILVGNNRFYHQDKNGWLEWCEDHFLNITKDFCLDLPGITRFNQRYFGDWVNYEGWGDVGYYLGARFVHFLCERIRFDGLITMKQFEIKEMFSEFVSEALQQ